MPPAKVSKKTYIRPDNTAVISCPHCGRQKTIHADSLKQHKSKLKIKCACKNIFTVDLEFRHRVRKPVSLRGTYTNHSQNEKTGDIRVRNISVSGLEFSTMDIQYFKVDDELTLKFNLDDDHRSEIRKEATVRDVRTNSVGCEFVGSGNLAFDGPLGLYVMS
jgi:hypothetical protein